MKKMAWILLLLCLVACFALMACDGCDSDNDSQGGSEGNGSGTGTDIGDIGNIEDILGSGAEIELPILPYN